MNQDLPAIAGLLIGLAALYIGIRVLTRIVNWRLVLTVLAISILIGATSIGPQIARTITTMLTTTTTTERSTP